jgi:AraC-like DNA-binding protein
LSEVKLTGAVFFSAEFSAPWGFSASEPKAMAAKVAPGAAHLVLYHLVMRRPQHRARRRRHHRARSWRRRHLSARRRSSHEQRQEHGAAIPQLRHHRQDPGARLESASGGRVKEISRFVCGYLTCDPHLSQPILNGLAAVFKVNIRSDRSGHWLETSIMHLLDEAASGQVDSEAMLAKLSEVLFVDTLRRHVATLPEQQVGWLAGARDSHRRKKPGVAPQPRRASEDHHESGRRSGHLALCARRALHAIHHQPPMTYLTRWWLQLAVKSLEKTSRGVADIAANVGYESEAAFSRAFKREFGEPPAAIAATTKTARHVLRSPRLVRDHICSCPRICLLA